MRLLICVGVASFLVGLLLAARIYSSVLDKMGEDERATFHAWAECEKTRSRPPWVRFSVHIEPTEPARTENYWLSCSDVTDGGLTLRKWGVTTESGTGR